MRVTLLKTLPLLVCAVAFNVVGLPAHASMSSSHATHHNSDVTSNVTCVSACMAMPSSREKTDESILHDEDDEPSARPDLTLLVLNASDEAVHLAEANIAAALHPPPEPPNYIKNAVFRV